MTQDIEECKYAYDALQSLCKENNNTETMRQLEIMVLAMGAERTHVITAGLSGLPSDVKSLMLKVCRYIEYKQGMDRVVTPK